MPWVKLDQDFPDHPKIVRAGPIGMVIYIRGLCYASRYLTDGFIPDAVAEKITSDLDEYAEEENNPGEILWWSLMTQVGLWKKVKGGFKIHNYLRYNRSARDVRKMLKQKAEAGKQGGIAKAKHRASRSPRKVSSKSLPDTDTDVDTYKPLPPYPPDFERFWQAYPKKRAKDDALKAWGQTEKTRPPMAELLASLKTQAESRDWTKNGGQYVPLPATWLRGRRWQDQLEPRFSDLDAELEGL